MEQNNKYLTCKAVSFYNNQDETIFFGWIEKIECISSISAARDELYLELVDRELTINDINDLLGLFARYQINMGQLENIERKKINKRLAPGKQRYL